MWGTQRADYTGAFLAIRGSRDMSRAMHHSKQSEGGVSSDDRPGIEPLSQFEESVRERLELAIGCLPSPVVTFIHRLFAHEDSMGGRAILQALNLASESGWQPVGVWEDRAIELESGSGERCLLTVLAFGGFEASAGSPNDVERAVDALKGAFGERRFMVAFRRPVPKNYDPEPMARAVSMWLVALQRGEAYGPHAIYEDDDVAVELTLMTGAPGHSFTIPPCTALSVWP